MVAWHGAAQAFGRARAIGVTKSVSLKKTCSVRFKISYQKVLKLKKNLISAEGESTLHISNECLALFLLYITRSRWSNILQLLFSS